MTNDLGGGIGEVTSFLIPGSELYDQANAFVNSVDITFVWSHSFTGFSNESVTNCIMYNDALFSCDVRCDKNMTLGGGEYRVDEFANRMIFAYIDNNVVDTPGWYLVNMQAITDYDTSMTGDSTTGATTTNTTTGGTTTNGTTGTTTGGTTTGGTTTGNNTTTGTNKDTNTNATDTGDEMYDDTYDYDVYGSDDYGTI